MNFFIDLRKFIKTKCKTRKIRTIILLDNACPHLAKQTTKFITENLDAVFYLPQNAPVKNFFHYLNQNYESWRGKTTNMN